jgi:hypothetical protein
MIEWHAPGLASFAEVAAKIDEALRWGSPQRPDLESWGATPEAVRGFEAATRLVPPSVPS